MGYYSGRVSVITGAGAGIGRALAVALARQGGTLALSDRDGDALVTTRRLCDGAHAVRCDILDVTDRAAVLDYAAAIIGEFGRVDVVLAVAGVIHTGSVLSSDFSDVERVMGVDFWGVVHIVKAFLPHVIASGGGHVVTVSSAFGLMGAPDYAAYCSAKFAVRAFSESLRQEMLAAGHPVSVTCVFPGGVRTSIMRTGTYTPDADRAAVTKQFDQTIARTEPAAAAATILRRVQKGRAQALVGVDAQVVWMAVRIAGAAYQRVLPALLRMARRRS